MAIIPACHAGDPSSILGCGGFFIQKQRLIKTLFINDFFNNIILEHCWQKNDKWSEALIYKDGDFGKYQKIKNVNGRIRTYDPFRDRSLVCCFCPLSHVYYLLNSNFSSKYSHQVCFIIYFLTFYQKISFPSIEPIFFSFNQKLRFIENISRRRRE